MSSEETFSVNGAARLTGFTNPTIRKRLPELQRAGAQLLGGRWQIPLSALYTAGLMSKVESKALVETIPPTFRVESIEFYNNLQAELEAVKAQLALSETRAGIAEAIAVERQKALEMADRALRMIEAKAPTAPRRRWYQL